MVDRKYRELVDRVTRERLESRKQFSRDRAKLEQGLDSIKLLLRACDYFFRRDEYTGQYDEPRLVMLERCGYQADDRYAEEGSSPEAVNRDLSRLWVTRFWLPAAASLRAWGPVAEVANVTPRSAVHELGSRLFLPILRGLPDLPEMLIEQTIADVAELRMALGRYGSGLESYLAQLAFFIYEQRPQYYEGFIADGGEYVVGRGHLDHEASALDVPLQAPFACSKHFLWLRVLDTWYQFRPGNQARAFQVLWEAFVRAGYKDGVGVSQEDIGDAIGSVSERFRMDQTFKGHPAFNQVIQRVGKGLFGIVLGLDKIS